MSKNVVNKFSKYFEELLENKKLSAGSKILISILVVILALIVSVAIIALHGYVLMLLWNWLAVSAFALPTVTYLQSVAVAVVLAYGRNMFGK